LLRWFLIFFFSEDADDRLCAFTDGLQGAEPAPTNELRGVVQENGTIRCSRGSRCYGLWEKRADGEMQLLNQGCWTHVGHQQECHGDRCVLVAVAPSQVQKANYRFCCCSRDLCNANFTEAPPTADTPETALVALVTVAIAAILIGALFLGYRVMKRKQKHSVSAVDVMEAANSQSAVDLDSLKLMEVPKPGSTWSLKLGLSPPTVLFQTENQTHTHTHTHTHPACGKHWTQQVEPTICWVLLLLHRLAQFSTKTASLAQMLGCLSRYLSVHSVDWSTCCRMTHGVTRGLAFLHTELYRADQYKPAVAHRDLSSRNVLVRADLSCVLADFGLSMRLTGSRACCHGDDDTMTISEVGTVRYMSPEVLGGALNLRDCESALKQVDVYALGLLYWESFRRCCDLFPGEAVPDYQLAFQAELGNHPSFEDMQVLVVREKFRPRFPEAWKENSLALRSLKETMEDCWDQDAEARLTAQCAEERLAELTLLSTHTSVHNHRNLSHGRWPPQVGSASPYIEDLQVGVVKNLQGDGHPSSLIKTTASGAEVAEKNRNYERQQVEVQRVKPGPGGSGSSWFQRLSQLLWTSVSQCSNCSCCPPGGVGSSVPVCLQLTEEDLEANKLDPKEVDKNLRETSDDNLMEHSQKNFGSDPVQTSSLLYHQLLHSSEVRLLSAGVPPQAELGVFVDSTSASIHHLPKQQNLPQRPTSLHLLPKAKDSSSASSRLKLGKFKSNHRQVETGVAKMNTVTVVAAAEPHLVTTVTNNTRSSAAVGKEVNTVTVVASGYSAGVPTLVTNGMIGGGRTNPAGPQVEDEDKVEDAASREDNRLNLLNFSPDEHEPLLSREQPPAESEPLHHHHHHHETTAVGEASVPVPAAQKSPALEPLTPVLLQSQVGQTKARRPERPCSLDLSSSCISSGDLSASGEKIKRRVKTPYTLKKWRPASWVVSTDTALDPDFDFNSTSSTSHLPGGLHRAGSLGIPRINQSKSSMAVFLVGGGATATTTSEPDGMTCF
uniref:Serine/threonine-protein kinase receptor n=1 Tax=Stegastes partitus TaxID=144197 RepID=A0A3B5A5P1_9TELE